MLFTIVVVFHLLVISGVNTEEDYRMDALNFHNKYRTNHGVQPLRLSGQLNQLALNQARLMVYQNRIIIDTKGLYGNLVFRSTPMTNVTRTIELVTTRLWYSGVKWFNFSKQSLEGLSWSDESHFLQMTWNLTTFVGFGMDTFRSKFGNTSWTYFVAYYDVPVPVMKDSFGITPPLHPLDPFFTRLSTSGRNPRDVAQDTVNKYRSFHRAPPSLWDKELSLLSKTWATTLASERRFNPRPSPPELRNSSVGENIFGDSTDFDSCDEENQGKFVERAIDQCLEIWFQIRIIGFGLAKSEDFSFCFLVINFFPVIGNGSTDYQENVIDFREDGAPEKTPPQTTHVPQNHEIQENGVEEYSVVPVVTHKEITQNPYKNSTLEPSVDEVHLNSATNTLLYRNYVCVPLIVLLAVVIFKV